MVINYLKQPVYHLSGKKKFMNKKLQSLPVFLLITFYSFSQGVGIGTTAPDASAALDITSINKGLLIPRMNITSINAINNPAKGLLVYDSAANQLMMNTGTPVSPNWQPVSSGNPGIGWTLVGNNGINPANQFIGTTDNQPFRFRVNNIQAGELHPGTKNIFWGLRSGQGNTTGFKNIAIGTDALRSNLNVSNLVAIGDSALFNNKEIRPGSDEAAFNTAIGSKSLFTNISGQHNTAIGYKSLYSNVGSSNTAIGSESLLKNNIGGANTGIGFQSLTNNIAGSGNAAIGFLSLTANTNGINNTAIGTLSLAANTIGDNNVAAGFQSLRNNITGGGNIAIGNQSLFSNTEGEVNIAVGSGALFSNTTGNNNTTIGFQALRSNTTGFHNTAIGSQSLRSNSTGINNIAIGSQSLFLNTTGQDNVAVGNFSLNSNTTGLGNTATGLGSLFSNTTGGVNTANGNLALNSNTTGNDNTALGVQSLYFNQTGSFNTAIGGNALSATLNSSNNTVVGFNAAFIHNLGNDNTLIGAGAEVSRDGIKNSVAIGKGAIVDASDKVRIGNGTITVIEGQVPFTTPSDGRFKYQVQEDVKGLDFIMQLRPVTYRFDVKRFDEQQIHGNGQLGFVSGNTSYDEAAAIRRTGFIAQEVEKAANASGYDFSGVIKPKTEQDHYGLSYESFVVPLVKAVQEQQALIEKLIKRIQQLEKKSATVRQE
jgi:hypothetical protein